MVRYSLDELIAELERMRDTFNGSLPVEVYDQETWEELPFLAVELAPAPTPGTILIIAGSGKQTAGGKRSG